MLGMCGVWAQPPVPVLGCGHAAMPPPHGAAPSTAGYCSMTHKAASFRRDG
jgi:hypothetical protein